MHGASLLHLATIPVHDPPVDATGPNLRGEPALVVHEHFAIACIVVYVIDVHARGNSALDEREEEGSGREEKVEGQDRQGCEPHLGRLFQGFVSKGLD